MRKLGLRQLLGFSIALGSLVSIVRASDARLELNCSHWAPSQRQELLARLELLLHGNSDSTARHIVIQCQGQSIDVTLRGSGTAQRERIDDSDARVESVLTAVEELLTRDTEVDVSSPAQTQVAPRQDNDQLNENELPPTDPLDSAFDRAPPPKSTRTLGGVGLGLSVEPWPAPASSGVGPRLELAWGAGSWVASAVESLRFGSTPDYRLVVFDASVGVGWGAPFASEPVGANLSLGAEWFSAAASSEPTGERTSSSTIVTLGLCTAWSWGGSALRLGVDGRWRTSPLELAEPVNARLNRWSLLFSVGGLLKLD